MATNPLREIWAENRTAFGLWSVVPGTIGAEILAQAGADYVCVDQQHGVIDYGSMVPMFQVIRGGGAAPITRVLSPPAPSPPAATLRRAYAPSGRCWLRA